MQENDYDCEIRWAWELAYWTYIFLFVWNLFFYFCGTSIWHVIGITMGFQMICYYPLFMNWPPSCLSYFLVTLKISLGKIDFLPFMRWIFFMDQEPNDGTANYRFD